MVDQENPNPSNQLLTPAGKRGVKSYVLRQGRLTPGQERALEAGWSDFGLKVDDGSLNYSELFGNNHPVTLEIGFGMGESLAQQARETPQTNFIGIEVHRPGVGHLLIQALEDDLSNLRVFAEDSLDVLNRVIPDRSLQTLQLFFPDPWPKKRHHKRRIVNRAFVELVALKLLPEGVLHFATDWVPYAEAVNELMAGIKGVKPVSAPARPETKFERRGLKLGHTVTDLAWRFERPLGSPALGREQQ